MWAGLALAIEDARAAAVEKPFAGHPVSICFPDAHRDSRSDSTERRI